MEEVRSIISKQEFRERRRKKMGVLPFSMFLSFNDRGVHPRCPHASNPYHKCVRYCIEKLPSGNVKDGEEVAERRGVNPSCPNASNPYHKCADYCFQKIPQETEKEQEENIADVDDRAVGPKCKNASNPYHVCSEYCFETFALDQPRKVSRLKSLQPKRKSSSNREMTIMNTQCKYASNPSHKCSKYCIQNTLERDVQPLSLDASDLLHEWAKYCSQKKAARDDHLKQYKRNGNENVIKRSFGSSTFEEVEAKRRLPSSLPSSVLFLLGVLLAMFYWAQLIHSLIASSDRSKAVKRVTHKIQNPKCKNESDP
ncbi:hypothetical protein AXF42_Ash019744 [Apostasia shenzhenica]|uniref:Uncharacterized protein n=1 Tax=Apostasia shenzhenica TaxID=1088818 RepID=A0A2H9ZRR4_9ASPA|nr:hypothetical protein AXF42_Ash019744 [Apostasia shenzhenica]